MAVEHNSDSSKKRQNSLAPTPYIPEDRASVMDNKPRVKVPQGAMHQPEPSRKSKKLVLIAAILFMALLCAGFFWLGTRMGGGETIQGTSIPTEKNPHVTTTPQEETTIPTEPIARAPIIAVDAAWTHVAALRADGTVSVVIEEGMDKGQGDTSQWTDMVAVCTGRTHTVGLRADGTVEAVGDNEFGQCDVSDWTDIIAIAAGDYFTVGLRSDGTLVAAGDNQWGQTNVDGLENIVLVDASDDVLYCYDAAGTLTMMGKQFDFHQIKPKNTFTSISVSLNRAVVLLPDGKACLQFYLSYEEEDFDVSQWCDLTKVSAGRNQIVGLTADGTVCVVGYNENGECDVGSWTDIVDICAANGYTVAVKSDGTVVAAGKYLQTNTICDVSELNRHTKLISMEEQDEAEAWSEWVLSLPNGITESDYEIQEKEQYSFYKKSQQNWQPKGSSLCQQCKTTPGISKDVVESVSETWEGCWRDENGDCVCGFNHLIGTVPPNLTDPIGGPEYTLREPLLKSATQYRYCDKASDGTYGQWSDWQFEAVSSSETRQVETRTVYQNGTRITKGTHYHCHPVWSAYEDTAVENDEDTVVRIRTVYRYRKIA